MSYSQQEIVAKRLFARGAGHALPLAHSFSMGVDPELSIGVCTIKIVTEEQVQAIAFGRIGQPPQILTRMDPLSRDVSDLTPFAQFIVDVGNEIMAGALVRCWTAQEAGMETIDLLGRRYVTNSEAPQIVRDMGRVCRAFGAQLQYSGQPVVACALEQLLDHFVSGQSPVEDRHLASMLTWVDPPIGEDIFEAASNAALLPASGILPNFPGHMHDTRIEVLRRTAKNTRDPVQRAQAHAEMHDLLAAAAQHEWDLMIRARHALLSLPSTRPADADLVREAHQRLVYHLGGGAFSVVQPHAISVELKRREANEAATARRAWRNDAMLRAAAVRRGRVLEGEILSIGPYIRGGTRPMLTDARQLRTGPGVVVTTLKKALHSLDKLPANEFNLVVIDEAYQASGSDVLPAFALSQRFALIGDPGQLDPIVTIDTAWLEASEHRLHRPAPKYLLDRGAANIADIIRLPATRRLVQDTVDFIQPAFYGNLPFASLANQTERKIHATVPAVGSDYVDTAIAAIQAGASIVQIMLPATPPRFADFDADVPHVIARIVSRIHERGVAFQDDHLVSDNDFICIDPHVASGEATRLALRNVGHSAVAVDTPERWQGLQSPIVIAKHPLTDMIGGAAFGFDPGRWCVSLSRHTHACVVIARAEIGERLNRYVHSLGDAACEAEDAVWHGYSAHKRIWDALARRGRNVAAA